MTCSFPFLQQAITKPQDEKKNDSNEKREEEEVRMSGKAEAEEEEKDESEGGERGGGRGVERPLPLFTVAEIKKIIKSLVDGLMYLHSAKRVHTRLNLEVTL